MRTTENEAGNFGKEKFLILVFFLSLLNCLLHVFRDFFPKFSYTTSILLSQDRTLCYLLSLLEIPLFTMLLFL